MEPLLASETQNNEKRMVEESITEDQIAKIQINLLKSTRFLNSSDVRRNKDKTEKKHVDQ